MYYIYIYTYYIYIYIHSSRLVLSENRVHPHELETSMKPPPLGAPSMLVHRLEILQGLAGKAFVIPDGIQWWIQHVLQDLKKFCNATCRGWALNIQLDPWPKWFMVIPQNDYHPAEQLLRKRGATSKSATNAAKNWRISVSKIRVNKRWNNPSNQHWPTTGDRYTIPHLSVCPHFLLFVLVWACTR